VAAVGDRALDDKELRRSVSRSGFVLAEAKARALTNEKDYSGAVREYERALALLRQEPSDSPEGANTLKRVNHALREANIRSLTIDAEALSQSRDYPKAIAAYDKFLNYLQQQPEGDPLVAQSRASAMEAKGSLESALIQARAEEGRRRQEEEQRRLVEERRRAEEAQRAAAEARQRKDRERFAKSAAYVEIRTQADSIMKSLESGLLLEDSAWRAISKSSEAATGLLGLLVRMEGAMAGQDVTADVSRAKLEMLKDLIGEDSALLAIHIKDRAFLDTLGTWCRVLEKNHPGLCASFQKTRQAVLLQMISENSAYRAQSAYLSACSAVLHEIVAAQGYKTEADKILLDSVTTSIGDNSAIRGATNGAETCASLVLLLVDQRSKMAAAAIRKDVFVSTLGEDSAVRAHAAYKKTLARSLYALIVAAEGQEQKSP